jgi:hypothetical protein
MEGGFDVDRHLEDDRIQCTCVRYVLEQRFLKLLILISRRSASQTPVRFIIFWLTRCRGLLPENFYRCLDTCLEAVILLNCLLCI